MVQSSQQGRAAEDAAHEQRSCTLNTKGTAAITPPPASSLTEDLANGHFRRCSILEEKMNT